MNHYMNQSMKLMNCSNVLFYEDSNTEDQLKDHANDIFKIVTYLNENQLNVTAAKYNQT